jgi:allantoinase
VEKLWTHIGNNECTFISSDHVSWGLERKHNPDVFKNASGGPGLETLLPAFWTGCQTRGISPSLVVRQLCRNPARHFLLDDRKGTFCVGADADLVLLKPERHIFDPANSLSAVQWSSFECMEFSVRVEGTYCRGRLVFDGSKIVNTQGAGRFLRPRPAGDHLLMQQAAV